jgi:hypothetical protein
VAAAPGPAWVVTAVATSKQQTTAPIARRGTGDSGDTISERIELLDSSTIS